MQEHSEDILIARLKGMRQTSRHAAGEPTWQPQRSVPPVTQEELAQAEAQLGFALPALLRRIYLEVGNGGFGPGYGFLPLVDHPLARASDVASLVAEYQGMRSMSQQDIDEQRADEEVKPSLWPERALTLCDWGCNIYSCLDCSSPDLTVYRMDSNVNFMVAWAVEASSLQQWLEQWVEGTSGRLDWKQATIVPVSQIGKHI